MPGRRRRSLLPNLIKPDNVALTSAPVAARCLILAEAHRSGSARGVQGMRVTYRGLAASVRLCLLLASAGGAAAWGQTPQGLGAWAQLAKLTASDGLPADQLGYSAAASGNTVVVGSPYATVGGNYAQGAVYLFTKPVQGWSNMTQVAKLTASDGNFADYFGYSVAISGNTVVVGAPNYSGNGPGAVYVFVKPSGGWTNMTETAKLTSSDGQAGDDLGWSVAIAGNVATAGAPAAGSYQGAAYVFVRPAQGWSSSTQTGELTALDGLPGDELGYAVATSGAVVAAGAVGFNQGQGAAYVFVEPGGGWSNASSTAVLTASDGQVLDGLGNSISIGGNTVVAGAPYASIAGHLQQGAAYVFVEPSGGWADGSETAKLFASHGQPDDTFGTSVAISGSTILAGAPGAAIGSNTGQGAAYVFVKPASGWQTTAAFKSKVTSSDGSAGDAFGQSLSITAGTVVIGAPGANIGGNRSQGAAYVFGP